jgi:hypothetical protein
MGTHYLNRDFALEVDFKAFLPQSIQGFIISVVLFRKGRKALLS